MNREEERRAKVDEDWVTKAFVALAPGWMAEYGDQDGGTFTVPIPGVLVEVRGDDTRVVAAEFEGSEILPLDGVGNLLRIFYEHRNRHRSGREIAPISGPEKEAIQ